MSKNEDKASGGALLEELESVFDLCSIWGKREILASAYRIQKMDQHLGDFFNADEEEHASIGDNTIHHSGSDPDPDIS